ncbi:MAG TPA: CsbD family protein [Gemmatimonadaceae bacterium]
MNWDQIKGNWRVYKGRVKERWGELSDDDLDRIDGKRDQLLGLLQNRYGKTREVAADEVREFEDTLRG